MFCQGKYLPRDSHSLPDSFLAALSIIQVSDRELKLEDVQSMVGGLIELVYPRNGTPAMMGIDDDAQYIVNEEGQKAS